MPNNLKEAVKSLLAQLHREGPDYSISDCGYITSFVDLDRVEALDEFVDWEEEDGFEPIQVH